MRDLIFACLLGTGESEKDALRLARSLRTFGGELCFSPIWMFSRLSEEELAQETRQELFSLGARLVSYEASSPAADIFMGSYVTAAGIAEGMAQGEASFLVLMGGNTLILQLPAPLLLPPGKSLGACPVHLKLLGSAYNEPLDPYWSLIYSQCHVDAGKVFPMQSVVDEQTIRAYFNAGMLVVRPERGLLRAWKSDFDRLLALPGTVEFLHQDELYEIFFHQAVLAGSVLSRLRQPEFQQLPFEMNYPLHLHSKVAESRRPSSLEQLITCRYEEFADTFNDPAVRQLVDGDAEHLPWLEVELQS